MKSTPFFRYVRLVLAIGVAILVGMLIAGGGVPIAGMLIVLPLIVLFLIAGFKSTHLFLHVIVAMGFLIAPLGRYVPAGGIPYGLSIDGLIILIFIAISFNRNVGFKKAVSTQALTFALLGWMVITILQIANPLARSMEAWFYAMRGLSLYPLMISLLTPYVYTKKSHINQYLIIWAVLSTIGTLWGVKQLFLGVNRIEQAWLDAGAASTHILFGKLRVFSYFSDAAQFGANQAFTGLVFGIIGLYPGKLKYRYLILAFAGLSLYGMLISGTRGALGVIALGGLSYLVLTKNFKLVTIGAVLGIGFFVFLKYTTIMQSNYQVNRLRTSLNSDDPSLQVRKERERVLANYLSDKPFGGGIGSAGFWGKRFSPGTFLAEIGTDGHYTRIWMETGIIGLYAYLAMIFAIVIYLGRLLWMMKDSYTRQLSMGIYSGFLGLCLSSYTNGLLTQIPTGTLVFSGLAIVHACATGLIKGGPMEKREGGKDEAG